MVVEVVMVVVEEEEWVQYLQQSRVINIPLQFIPQRACPQVLCGVVNGGLGFMSSTIRILENPLTLNGDADDD